VRGPAEPGVDEQPLLFTDAASFDGAVFAADELVFVDAGTVFEAGVALPPSRSASSSGSTPPWLSVPPGSPRRCVVLEAAPPPVSGEPGPPEDDEPSPVG
jgi:hypothetical protein